MSNSFFILLFFDSYDVPTSSGSNEVDGVYAVDGATFYYTPEFFSSYLVYLEIWWP